MVKRLSVLAGTILATVLVGAAIPAANSAEEPAAPGDVNPAFAIFAGGCFWCVEADFDKLDGVIETQSGYTGGYVDNPTYKQVSHEDTGHYEAVKITYDPSVVGYATLVEHFFRHVDPLDPDGQFCDRGD